MQSPVVQRKNHLLQAWRLHQTLVARKPYTTHTTILYPKQYNAFHGDKIFKRPFKKTSDLCRNEIRFRPHTEIAFKRGVP